MTKPWTPLFAEMYMWFWVPITRWKQHKGLIVTLPQQLDRMDIQDGVQRWWFSSTLQRKTIYSGHHRSTTKTTNIPLHLWFIPRLQSKMICWYIRWMFKPHLWTVLWKRRYSCNSRRDIYEKERVTLYAAIEPLPIYGTSMLEHYIQGRQLQQILVF